MIRMVLCDHDTGMTMTEERVIECWHCKNGIIFKAAVPAVCPKCSAKQPFAEHLIGVNKRKIEHAKKIYYKGENLNDVTCYNLY